MPSRKSAAGRFNPKSRGMKWVAKVSPNNTEPEESTTCAGSPGEEKTTWIPWADYVETKMLRIVIGKEHSVSVALREKYSNRTDVRFRIVGSIPDGCYYPTKGDKYFFLGQHDYGRDLYPRLYKLGEVEGEILGPLSGGIGGTDLDGCLHTMMMTVGEGGEFQYEMVVVEKMTNGYETVLERSPLKKVHLKEPGAYTLYDQGKEGSELVKENWSTNDEENYYACPAVTKAGQWQVMDSFNPDKPSFAIRLPKKSVKKMLVYFHGKNGTLDQENDSIFTLECAPPGLDDEVLEDAVLLCPCSPKYRSNGAPMHWLRHRLEGTTKDFVEASIRKAGEDIYGLIELVRKHYEVPPEMISCYGFSNGGYAVLQLCALYPNLFKKAGCMGGHFYKLPDTVAKQFPARVPLAIFHNVNDNICDVEDMYKLVSRMKKDGKPISYSFTLTSKQWDAHCLTEFQAKQEGFITWVFDDETSIEANKDTPALLKPRPKDGDKKKDTNEDDDDHRPVIKRPFHLDLQWLEPKYKHDYRRLLKKKYTMKTLFDERGQPLYKSLPWGIFKQSTTSLRSETEPGEGKNLNESLPHRLKGKFINHEMWKTVKTENSLSWGNLEQTTTTLRRIKTKPGEQNLNESLPLNEERLESWSLIQQED